jgi:hypothetical protein
MDASGTATVAAYSGCQPPIALSGEKNSKVIVFATSETFTSFVNRAGAFSKSGSVPFAGKGRFD